MRRWLCVLALACGVATLDSPRDARWFFGSGTVTKVVVSNHVITEMVPSSCVEVAPSLPPCRGMRELTFAPSPTERISPTSSAAFLPDDAGDTVRDGRFWDFGWSSVSPSQHQQDEGSTEATPTVPPPPPVAWTFNDLWSGGYTTVTQTVVHEETLRMKDNEHVVTFSVVGCMPTRLPFDLAACKREDAVPTPTAAPLDPRAAAGAR